VDAHIFQSEPEQMQVIEQRISQVEADMTKAAGEYEALSTFPGEHAIWEDPFGRLVTFEGLFRESSNCLARIRTHRHSLQWKASKQALKPWIARRTA
jgi:hypothetical protein